MLREVAKLAPPPLVIVMRTGRHPPSWRASALQAAPACGLCARAVSRLRSCRPGADNEPQSPCDSLCERWCACQTVGRLRSRICPHCKAAKKRNFIRKTPRHMTASCTKESSSGDSVTHVAVSLLSTAAASSLTHRVPSTHSAPPSAEAPVPPAPVMPPLGDASPPPTPMAASGSNLFTAAA